MRILHAPVLVALALVALAPAAAADDVTLRATAFDGGGEYWFRFEGFEAQNPTIPLQPGDRVTLHVTNEGRQVHNLRFGPPVEQATAFLQPGENATITFQVDGGTFGTSQYWCDPHRQLLMRGPVLFGTADDGDAPEETATIPASGLIAACAAAAGAASARRRRERPREGGDAK